MSHHVYFIKPVGMDGPIKIGCSFNRAERLLRLQAWVPFKLEVLVEIPGNFILERRIQSAFFGALIHSEWFNPVPELVALIDKLLAGVPIEEAIDLPPKGKTGNLFSPERRAQMSIKQKAAWARRRLLSAEAERNAI